MGGVPAKKLKFEVSFAKYMYECVHVNKHPRKTVHHRYYCWWSWKFVRS